MYKQDMKNYSVYNVCCIFEDNYIFKDKFNTSSWPYQPIPKNCNDKIYGAEGQRTDTWERGLRVEKNKLKLF